MKPDPKLNRIAPDEMPDDIASAWTRSMDLRGDATFFEVFANHPELYRWYVNQFYGDVFRGGKVAQRYKELLRLRLSTLLHGCRFCNQGNRLDALEAGLTEAQIAAFESTRIGAVYARRARRTGAGRLSWRSRNSAGILSEALHAQLAAHFDDAQILELGLVGGILAGVAKFMFAYDLVEKEDSCPFHPVT